METVKLQFHVAFNSAVYMHSLILHPSDIMIVFPLQLKSELLHVFLLHVLLPIKMIIISYRVILTQLRLSELH